MTSVVQDESSTVLVHCDALNADLTPNEARCESVEDTVDAGNVTVGCVATGQHPHEVVGEVSLEFVTVLVGKGVA